MNKANKYIINSSWLIIGRVLKMVLGFLITIYVARYLGPNDFGQFNYVISLVLIFSIFSNLGFEHLMMRDFARYPEKEEEYLLTTTFLKLIGGSAAFLILIAVSYIMHGSSYLLSLTIIYSASLIFQGFNMIATYYEAIIKARLVIIASLTQTVIFVIVKYLAIINKLSLHWFILIEATQWLLISSILWIYYFHNHKSMKFKLITFDNIKYLFSNSWPFILSGGVALIYQRIDQVMLKAMISSEAVGYYSAAAKIIIISSYFPVLLANSLVPALTKAYKKSEEFYLHIRQLFNDAVIFLGFAITIVFFLFSTKLVQITFGEMFDDCNAILKILIFKNLFLAIAIGADYCILVENKQKLIAIKQVLGVIINIVLNIILIKAYGAVGAAIATIVTYLTIGFIFNALFTSLRPLFRVQCLSILNGFTRLKKLKKSISVNS
jgi:O-antigen/teichoic acid export membrane protein